jgi:glycosyltransferase involved in cell wall biosynthesis
MNSIKKIKVLFVIHHPDSSGSNKALINVLDGITTNGILPLVVMAYKGSICSKLEERNIEYKIIRHYFSIYPPLNTLRDLIRYIPRLLGFIWYNYLAVNKLHLLVKKNKPHIIHTNVGPIDIGYKVAKKLKIPHIWHIREYQDLDFGIIMPSKKTFTSKLNAFANNSIVITKDLVRHFDVKNNVRVVYDGVLNASDAQFNKTKENYFLFVGKLAEGKGIRVLIEAFIDFSKTNDNYDLQIAGDGLDSYVLDLHRLIENAGITNRVRFLGFQSNVYNLMANATALIVPSFLEGFGFITAEAMFNGCLVIGNNSGGTKEILEKENLGILYSGHNELVSSMSKVISNGIENYYPMMIKAQNHAVSNYSIEKNATTIFEFYKEILKKNKFKFH